MSKVKIGFGVVAGVLMAYAFATPYITVHNIKQAVEKRDADALSAYVEFPSVRQSVKEQMNTALARKLGRDENTDNPLAALGMAVGGLLVDTVVDAYVAPEGIRQLMVGEQPKVVQVPVVEPSEAPTTQKPLSNASMSYQSLNQFVVLAKNKEYKEVQFVLRRTGLTWKLVDILLPQD